MLPPTDFWTYGLSHITPAHENKAAYDVVQILFIYEMNFIFKRRGIVR